jgi:hypothetical protein
MARAVQPGQRQEERQQRHRHAAAGVLGESDPHAGIARPLERDVVGEAGVEIVDWWRLTRPCKVP